MLKINRPLSYFFKLFAALISVASAGIEADIWKVPPEQFSSANASPNSSDLAVSPAGTAIAIWDNNDGFFEPGVKVSVFSNGAWGPSQLISTSGYAADTTRVATDNTGTALAIWDEQFPGQIKTSYFNGLTWVSPLPDPLDVLTNTFAPAHPSIAMNGSGGGIAIWVDTGTSNVRSSTFTFPSWSVPATIGSGSGSTNIAYSSNGTAVAVWNDGGTINVSNYIGGVWQGGIPVGLNLSSPLGIGISSSGTAIAAWLDPAGNVQVSFFSGLSWSLPQNISLAPGNTDLTFKMASNGTAVIAWVDAAKSGYSSVFNGVVWSTPFLFASGIANANTLFGFTSTLSVAVDTLGNAIIEWASLLGDIRSARLPFGTGAWIDQSIVTPPLVEQIIQITAGLADSGRGFSVWRFADTAESSSVQGSFTLFPPAPLAFQGRTCNNKFATQTDRVNILSWFPTTDPSVSFYYLRRNGVLIAIIPATGPFVYEDHNRCGRADVYTLTSVEFNGLESAPLVVILQ